MGVAQVGVGVGVGVNVAVGVGVGVPHETSVAVSTCPLLTGGLWPPVVSQPYCVKVVFVCFTPTTNWLSFAIVAGVIEPYMKRNGGFAFSYKATS
jgi:hypothetical protein